MSIGLCKLYTPNRREEYEGKICLVSDSFLLGVAPRKLKIVECRKPSKECFSDAGCRSTLVEATGLHSLTARHVETWSIRQQTFCYAKFYMEKYHGVWTATCIGLSTGGEHKCGEAKGGFISTTSVANVHATWR